MKVSVQVVTLALIAFLTLPLARAGDGRRSSVEFVDRDVQVTRLQRLIDTKQSEIRLNDAELMAIELRGLSAPEREDLHQKLALANEVLRSEIDDLSAQRMRLQESSGKQASVERRLLFAK